MIKNRVNNQKKLTLSKETLQELTPAETGRVVGGMRLITVIGCDSLQNGCTGRSCVVC